MTNDFVNKMTADSDEFFVDQKKRAEKIIAKWEKTSLLKNLNETSKRNMALILENEAMALKSEMLNESTVNANIAGFAKIAFPLVRRVFANLIADKIVSIQPMAMPSGLIFYQNFKYSASTAKPPYTANGSVYGDLDFQGNVKLEGIGAQTANGGFYGLNSNYGYRIFRSGTSVSATTYSGATTAAATSQWVSSILTENGKTVTAQKYLFDFGANINAVDLSNLRQFTVVPSSVIKNDTGASFRGFVGVATANSAFPILKSETDLDTPLLDYSVKPAALTGGRIVVWSVSGALVGTSNALTGAELLFNGSTDLTNRGEFEAVAEIPELEMETIKIQIDAKERKIKTKWTPEAAQDLNAFLGLDMELELTKMLSEQMIIDIDREIINDLIKGAHFRDVWSRKIGTYLNVVNGQVVATTTTTDILGYGNGANGAGPVFKGTQKDWYQTLVEKINKMSNNIYKVVLRGKANFIVTSTTVAAMLESMDVYKMDISANTVGSIGSVKIGTLESKYAVYVDPYLPDGIILVGFKGNSELHAGYVYAPYIPAIVSPTVYDPENFTPRKYILQRSGMQIVRPDYYGVIYVKDLDLF